MITYENIYKLFYQLWQDQKLVNPNFKLDRVLCFKGGFGFTDKNAFIGYKSPDPEEQGFDEKAVPTYLYAPFYRSKPINKDLMLSPLDFWSLTVGVKLNTRAPEAERVYKEFSLNPKYSRLLQLFYFENGNAYFYNAKQGVLFTSSENTFGFFALRGWK